MKDDALRACPVEEIKPCPYINGFMADNTGVSFMLRSYDTYKDFILFEDGKPNRCFRFTRADERNSGVDDENLARRVAGILSFHPERGNLGCAREVLKALRPYLTTQPQANREVVDE